MRGGKCGDVKSGTEEARKERGKKTRRETQVSLHFESANKKKERRKAAAARAQTFGLPGLVDGLGVVRDLFGNGLDVLFGRVLAHQLVVQFVGIDGHFCSGGAAAAGRAAAGAAGRVVAGHRQRRLRTRTAAAAAAVVRPQLGRLGHRRQFGGCVRSHNQFSQHYVTKKKSRTTIPIQLAIPNRNLRHDFL